MELRQLRIAAGFRTQQEFADATGLSQGFISEVEAGLKKPGMRAALIMSKALGITLDELMRAEGDD